MAKHGSHSNRTCQNCLTLTGEILAYLLQLDLNAESKTSCFKTPLYLYAIAAC